jgi:hypothetical protein
MRASGTERAVGTQQVHGRPADQVGGHQAGGGGANAGASHGCCSSNRPPEGRACLPGADARGLVVTRGTPSQGGLPASEPGLDAGAQDLTGP